jgi:hypothetical protein
MKTNKLKTTNRKRNKNKKKKMFQSYNRRRHEVASIPLSWKMLLEHRKDATLLTS